MFDFELIMIQVFQLPEVSIKMAEAETTVEFAVNLTCSNCVKATEKVLKATPGITDFSVDLVWNIHK